MNNTGDVMEIPPPCCHAALLLNAAIWLDNADSTVTRPKHCQKNHLGKQGHLAEGCWRLRRLCLLTALAIMKHLVYQTPTEGGREQGSRGWEKEERENERERETFCLSFFFISTARFSRRFIAERKQSGKSFPCLDKKKKRATIKREPCTVIWLRQSCQD